MNRFLGVLWLLWLALLVPAPAVAQSAPAWLQTHRQTALWSGPGETAEQFTTLPAGSFAIPHASEGQRSLVYYPGDGATRQPGTAWLNTQDVTPSGPPPWIATSELDGTAALARTPDAPRRSAYVAPPEVSAPEVAVVDDTTGLLLYGRAAHTRQSPASTTKILTALLAIERAPSLDDVVTITVDGWAMALQDGSSIMGLSPGQRVSIRTLLYGLMLPSGNDAAEQLARSLGESRLEFVAAMNARVGELGLRNSRFANPSGLDAVGHYSSPYDLAQLARVALRSETFREIVATPRYTAEGFDLRGHNPLLGAYPGTDGVKTGTTDQAGRAIVASAVRDEHRLLVVAMHSDDLYTDATALFDWAWSSFTWD